MLKAAIVSQEEFLKLGGSIDTEEAMVDRCAGLVDAETRNTITETLRDLSIGQESKQSQLSSPSRSIVDPMAQKQRLVPLMASFMARSVLA